MLSNGHVLIRPILYYHTAMSLEVRVYIIPFGNVLGSRVYIITWPCLRLAEFMLSHFHILGRQSLCYPMTISLVGSIYVITWPYSLFAEFMLSHNHVLGWQNVCYNTALSFVRTVYGITQPCPW